MNRETQIEEMAKVMCEDCADYGECKYSICDAVKDSAATLYNAGYRKQIVEEWIAKDNFNGRCSIATCSNCGTEKAFSVLVSIETIASLYPYCQKCGAKMKGGAE